MSTETPRIGPLPREEWTDAAREVFAFWGEPGAWENGSKTNIVNTMATHPALGIAYYTFGKHLLLACTLSRRVCELAILRISWRLKNEYEWHYHVGYAVNEGMTFDEIAAIKIGADAGNWNAQDRAVLQAVDDLIDGGRVGDAAWAELSKHFDKRQLMDLVFTIGKYVMLTWALSTFGVQLEDGVDQIGFDLKTASGKDPGARYRPGEVEDWVSKNG